MAKAALERVGCGRVMLCAFWPHALQVGVAEMLPERWLQRGNIWTIRALKVLKEGEISVVLFTCIWRVVR